MSETFYEEGKVYGYRKIIEDALKMVSLGRVSDTKFGTDVSSKKLLNVKNASVTAI